MNLDLRSAAIERAAQAWADFYLWAQEQPNLGYAKRRHYTGEIADDILLAVGISFDADHAAYREAIDEVVERGYVLAGGKQDRRGAVCGGNAAELRSRARALRRKRHTLRAIAEKLGVSQTTVYRMLRRAA